MLFRSINAMIKEQSEVYNWQFTFLGANQDAFAEARSLGIAAHGTANFDPKNSNLAYLAASSNVSRMRFASSVGEQVLCSYTDEERDQLVK